MNIFVTSIQPQACAEALDDKRLNKMIVETAQILCTVMGGKYAPTHENHPVVAWTRSSRSNAAWLVAFGIFACEEWAKRFAKHHACLEVIEDCRGRLVTVPDTRKDQSPESKEPLFPTSFCNCSAHPDVEDVTHAYRMTLNDKWDKDVRRPVWSNRKPPAWARWKSLRQDFSRDHVVAFKYHYDQKNKRVKLDG